MSAGPVGGSFPPGKVASGSSMSLNPSVDLEPVQPAISEHAGQVMPPTQPTKVHKVKDVSLLPIADLYGETSGEWHVIFLATQSILVENGQAWVMLMRAYTFTQDTCLRFLVHGR